MLRLQLELSRPHPRTKTRGLSLRSVQRVTPEDRQMVLERTGHKLMETKESKQYSTVVEAGDCRVRMSYVLLY